MDPHSSPGALEQYVDGNLSDDDSSSVRAHLEGCEQCQLRLADIALDGQWKGQEARREPRVSVDFPGRLKLLDPLTSVGPPHDVRVVEISRGGMKIRTPRYLITKTLVQILMKDIAVLGEVRYCIRADSEYYAGIRLTADFPLE